MELIIKHFDELTTDELFAIYKVRTEIFVVEQKCPYREIDDFDKVAIHLWYQDGDGIKAYIRVLPPNTVFEEPSIGRVLATERRQGLGSGIVKEGISIIRENFKCNGITIEAQVYARKMYERLGFVQISEEFLDEGIPHIKMRLSLE